MREMVYTCDICGSVMDPNLAETSTDRPLKVREMVIGRNGSKPREIEDVCVSCSEAILKLMNELEKGDNEKK